MSAKKARKSTPSPAASTASPAEATPAIGTAATAGEAWVDSPDPKKRQWARIFLVAIWLYVAALWLLALDQWFHWDIFGPKIPPTP